MSGNRNPALEVNASTRWPEVRSWVAAIVLGAGLATAAQGDDRRAMPPSVLPAYLQECASCHVAYPPGLLPVHSWQRLMGGLEGHYGSDASLDAKTAQQISAWLQAHAGTYRRVGEEPREDRITQSAWFERKHRKLDPEVWRLASVRSAANCPACHAAADRGLFGDHDLRLPEGLAARHRRAWND